MSNSSSFPVNDFLAPRFWGVWLGLGLLRLVAMLPYAVQMALGRLFGRLLYAVVRERRQIAAINLQLCFPDLDEIERHRILKQHFESVGMSTFETGMCWWWPKKRLDALTHIEGLEHLQDALQKGKGVILLSGHFTTLEIGATLLSIRVPLTAMYRKHKNPLFNAVIKHARERHALQAIARKDVRAMLRSLKQGIPVWYAPDQDFGKTEIVYVPFFGIPTATITATSRFAKMADAVVIPFFQHRRKDGSGYDLKLSAPLSGFPTDDESADAVRINQVIEDEIRTCPEEYLWIHRRFKRQPPGQRNPYRQAKS